MDGKPASVTGEKDLMNEKGLMNRGFFSVVSVSFFGAANDNILKQILILMVVAGGLWANRVPAGTQGIISLVLTVPFIFLSGYAGQVADRFSKRNVILWVKIAEIPIALFALLGLFLGSFWLSLFALLLLAVQSSFYGPAKFGVIPDVVDEDRLSQANGLINAISNVAVILGSLLAGPLADLYYPTVAKPAGEVVQLVEANDDPVMAPGAEPGKIELGPDPNRKPNRLPIGLALVTVSIFGLIVAYQLPKMQAVDPKIQFSPSLLKPHIQTFKDASWPLIVVMFSWSGFYLIGALALLLLPEYRGILGVSNTEITNVMGLLAISIVIGSCTVGFLSGRSIRPYYALCGAIGMTVCFALMGSFGSFGLPPISYNALIVIVFFIGFSAGFYIVPLQSLLQLLSPSDERGRFFGTANALSFVFISAAGLIYFALRKAGLPTEKIPWVCAGFAVVGTILGFVELQRILSAQKQTVEEHAAASSQPNQSES